MGMPGTLEQVSYRRFFDDFTLVHDQGTITEFEDFSHFVLYGITR